MKHNLNVSIWLVVTLFMGNIVSAQQEIFVDLAEQRAYAINNGKRLFSGAISSGKDGRETPTGYFKVLDKDKYHVSNLWPKPNGGAKMPYMIRITNSGIAMHIGRVPGYRASHGCIRLKRKFAKRLYKWVKFGTPVIISNGDGGHFYDYGGYDIHVENSYKLKGAKKDDDGYQIIETY